MNCPEYKDKISLLALGELPAGEKDDVEAHLEQCPDCRAEYESFLSVVGMYAVSRDDDLVPMEKLQLENDILRRLIETRNKAQRSFRLTGPWPAITRLAAALLIFFAGFAAQYFLGDLGRPRQANVTEKSKIAATAPLNRAIASGMRFSSQGLKVIAHGRAAIDVKP